MNYSNVNDIVLELSKIHSQSDIGQIFSESLYSSRFKDRIALSSIDDSVTERRLQSRIMADVKSSLVGAIFFPYEFKNFDYGKINIVNYDSLLGSVCLLIKAKGDDAFLDISHAMNKGSTEYLKKVTWAKYMNAEQFKEYRSIKTEIQRLL